MRARWWLTPPVRSTAGARLHTDRRLHPRRWQAGAHGRSGRNDLLLQGGKLWGSGTMDANVINSGGNVAPGDSPGNITIAGNYMQSTGGELDILFSDTNAFDVLNVLGTATLGGTLKITVEDHRGRHVSSPRGGPIPVPVCQFLQWQFRPLHPAGVRWPDLCAGQRGRWFDVYRAGGCRCHA